MKKTYTNLYKYFLAIIIASVSLTFDADAAVASRPTAANRAAMGRTQNSASVRAATKAGVSPNVDIDDNDFGEEDDYQEDEFEEPIIVDNKASMFGDVISEISSGSPDSAQSSLADAIRRQREALDLRHQSGDKGTGGNKTGAIACDSDLRKCMMEKCGKDFTKCANDSTVIWGTKLDACRTKTNCTAHEFDMIAPEIAADRDMNVQLSYYYSVLDCGAEYNDCIFGICGNTLDGCLSKDAEDKAISACESKARECREQDSGLAARIMNIFSEKRSVALAEVQVQEARLVELRDLMRTSCETLGAMFDERTFDCVYTVNFFAGDGGDPMASRKLYAGDSFQCTPDWFGIDVTSYKENAWRTTRAQTSASSAMLGSGLGTAAGMITSGAWKNGMDTASARKTAKEDCKGAGKKWSGGKCVDKTADDLKKEKEQQDKKNEKLKQQRQNCTNKGNGYEWTGTKCVEKKTKNPK